MAEPCKRCGDARADWWCCTVATDGPAWRTLGFHDAPLTAYRVRDGFVEVREFRYGSDEAADPVVPLSAADLATIAAALEASRG